MNTDRKTQTSAEDEGPTWLMDLDDEQVKRQTKFFQTRVKHPKFDAIESDLMRLLTPHTESNIIAVLGATGVGKSTLADYLRGVLISESAALIDSDPSTIPSIYVKAGQDAGTKHGIKHLYNELIGELQEPGTDRKYPAERQDGRIIMASRTSGTTRTLRETLRTAIKARGTRVVVLDEAAHLRSYGNASDVANTLKTLVDLAPNTKWLVIGGFDLFELLSESPQVLRRATMLGMERYRAKVKKDEAAFALVVELLQSVWPIPEEVPQFTAIAKHLLHVTVGCIGNLKGLMLEAAACQMRNGGKWEPQFLKNAAKPPGVVKTMEEELLAGERLIRDHLYGTSNWSDNDFAEMVQSMGRTRQEVHHAA